MIVSPSYSNFRLRKILADAQIGLDQSGFDPLNGLFKGWGRWRITLLIPLSQQRITNQLLPFPLEIHPARVETLAEPSSAFGAKTSRRKLL
jgi:hypothetical protein